MTAIFLILTVFKITSDELVSVEHGCRKDLKVVEQCIISGVAREDMHKVYCDP